MTIQVLNGTILIEFYIYYRDFHIVKELYCESDIWMPYWSVNIECCAFTSICKRIPVAHSGTSESIKEKCISSEQTNNGDLKLIYKDIWKE